MYRKYFAGEVSFSKYAYAENVIVQDRINSVHLPTFFEDIVGVNDDIVIPGETTFTDKVFYLYFSNLYYNKMCKIFPMVNIYLNCIRSVGL